MKTLRPYQQEAVDAVLSWMRKPSEGRATLVVAPVAAGKSLLIAETIRSVHEIRPRTRIVVVTHVKELLEQNYRELLEQYRDVDAGFYCAGLGQKKLFNDVTFASIQSIVGKVNNFNRAPQIILCDECHLMPKDDETQYRKFITDCRELNPKCLLIGFTGTDYRADSGKLDEGDDRLFDSVAYRIPMSFMIEQGYWAKPFTPKTKTVLSTEGVPTSKGDYIASHLEKAVDVLETTRACVDEIIALGADRHKWLVFTAGILHCEHVRDEIRSRGVVCEMVTGKTPKSERDKIITDYKAGRIKALVNVAVLTAGFNDPEIDLLVLMRPTKSPVLYVQTVGRVVRPVYAKGFDLGTLEGRFAAMAASGKQGAMVLDFGRVIETLGAIDAIDIKRPPKKEKAEPGEAPTKLCPQCDAICMAAQRYCYDCAYEFPASSVIEPVSAKNKALLAADVEPERHEVIDVTYKWHQRIDKPTPSMRVSYITEAGAFNEWVCFQHEGFAKAKAEKWHKERLPLFPIPETIEQAVELPYPKPKAIWVRKEGKYDKVISVEFDANMEPVTIIKHTYKDAVEVDLDEIPF